MNYVSKFLRANGNDKIRDYFTQNSHVISHELIYSLMERMPYEVSEGDETFILSEGILFVIEDKIHFKSWC
ncbi:hypothetical protein SAMN05444280_1373 [Tangfeifania diversioriginum]|uniref:Uncharacterized protein n=2 Tax=Tangfeifania diversioriginum TaxID=1168035 RepID=A0A1M6MX79_9BACT|nr:hypothetical protein SAMN05444280_1373 [Tangfeifania diversioriginum]